MKIGGPGRVASQSGRAGGARKAAGGFKVDTPGRAGGAKAAGATAAMGRVDALLSVQGAQTVEDASTGRRRAVKRARDLVDQLEEMRDDILAGQIPLARLRALVATLERDPPAVDDPALGDLLADIELRARVELAKYDQAS